jgi:hypothetical protein
MKIKKMYALACRIAFQYILDSEVYDVITVLVVMAQIVHKV